MKRIAFWTLIVAASISVAGCGGDDAVEDEITEPAAPAAEVDAEPAIELPDGFPEEVPLPPGFAITDAQVLDADQKQYSITGDSKMDVDAVLDFYLKAFEKDGWEEDSVMTQKANIVCSFIKDDLLVFVEANTGGIGTIVQVITGTQD